MTFEQWWWESEEAEPFGCDMGDAAEAAWHARDAEVERLKRALRATGLNDHWVEAIANGDS